MSALKDKLVRKYGDLHKKYHHLMYGQCAVLLYHRVTTLEDDPQLLNVSPDNFNAHLEIIKKEYNAITIEELFQYITTNKKIPKRSVAITFDDGYADNYLEALPILEKNDVQALFYIMTGNLNTNEEFWWDKVERILLCSSEPSVSAFQLGEMKFDLTNWTAEKKSKVYEQLLPIYRRMPSKDRDTSINELAEIFNAIPSRTSHRSMTFDELKRMDNSKNAVLGLHTHFHPSLGSLTYEQQLDEIKTSKEILENLLDRKLTYFSYPFGTISDYNNDTLKICTELGLNMVAANYPAIVNKRVDALKFPRFLVRDWEKEEFRGMLNSFFQNR